MTTGANVVSALNAAQAAEMGTVIYDAIAAGSDAALVETILEDQEALTDAELAKARLLMGEIHLGQWALPGDVQWLFGNSKANMAAVLATLKKSNPLQGVFVGESIVTPPREGSRWSGDGTYLHASGTDRRSSMGRGKPGFSDGLSMVEPKQKLYELEKYFKGQSAVVYQFAAFVADRLKDPLDPGGVVMIFVLALVDLERGVDGLSGKQIRGTLVGYTPQIYHLLQMKIPQIVEKVFPKSFADQAIQFFNETSPDS